MKKGRCTTMTHDYKRHGTTTLFAALDMATGKVIGKTYRKHRHQEVLRFLREVDKAVPKGQEIHIVLDNYATHKHEKVLAWIERRYLPAFHSDQRVVGEHGGEVLRDSDAKADSSWSVYIGATVREVLREYLKSYNEDPRLVWTKTSRRSSKKFVGVERNY